MLNSIKIIFSFIQVYDSNSIWTFHNLVTHHGANKQAPELMMQCLAAIFLLRCLKAKKYYEDFSEDPRKLTETEVFICKLVHHFMRVTYYNTHEVSHLKGTSFPRLIVPRAFNLKQGLGAFVPGVVVLRASPKVEAL